MSRRSTILVQGLLLLSGFGYSQPLVKPPGYAQTPLRIGDPVPDISFNTMLNYSASKAKLSDLRGQLTILDFWSTACGGCVALFPHLQDLEDKFGGRLHIVLVDAQATRWHDNAAKVEKALLAQESISGKKITMPVVLNSAELFDAFPHIRVPHEVWIDSLGDVMAITDAFAVTQSNIRSILNGNKVAFRIKQDISGDLSSNSLLHILDNTPDATDKPIFSTVIYKGVLDGLNGTGYRTDEQSGYKGMYVVNAPLLNIYRFVFSNLMEQVPANRIVIESSQYSEFRMAADFDQMEDAPLYAIDINTSPMPLDSLLKMAQGELNSIFHTRVYVSKRYTNCWILKPSPNPEVNTVKPESKSWEFDRADSALHINGYSGSELVDALNKAGFPIALVWESDSPGKAMEISLPENLSKTELVRERLMEQGLKISQERRELEVVVIGDQ